MIIYFLKNRSFFLILIWISTCAWFFILLSCFRNDARIAFANHSLNKRPGWYFADLLLIYNYSFTSFLSMQTSTNKKKKNDLNFIFSWYCIYNRTIIQNTIPWFEHSQINMYSFSAFSQFAFIFVLFFCMKIFYY